MNTSSPTIIKTYGGIMRYGALPPALFALATLCIPFLFAQGNILLFIGLIPVALLLGALFSFISLVNLNQRPQISTTELGLFVSYNLGRVFVPWESITMVRERKTFMRSVLIYSDALPWFFTLFAQKWIGSKRAFLIDFMLAHQEIEEILYLIKVNSNAEWKQA